MDATRSLIAQLIKKHADLIGPQLAVSLARKTGGLKVSENGDILELTDKPQKVLARLIEVYTSFAGEITHLIVKRVTDEHPEGHA